MNNLRISWLAWLTLGAQVYGQVYHAGATQRGAPAPRPVLVYSPPAEFDEICAKHFQKDQSGRWFLRDDADIHQVELPSGYTAYIDLSTFGISGIRAQRELLARLGPRILASESGEVRLEEDEIPLLKSAGLAVTEFSQECLRREPLTLWSGVLSVSSSRGWQFATGGSPTATDNLRAAQSRLREANVRPSLTGEIDELYVQRSSFAIRPVTLAIPSVHVATVLRECQEAAAVFLDEERARLAEESKSLFDRLALNKFPFLSGLPAGGADLSQLPEDLQETIHRFVANNWRSLGYESQSEAEFAVTRESFQIRPVIKVTYAEPTSFTVQSIRL